MVTLKKEEFKRFPLHTHISIVKLEFDDWNKLHMLL